MKLKYVLTEHNDFAIFTELTSHDDIAKTLHGKPVGAGFCYIEGDGSVYGAKVTCHGESISLGIRSKKLEDSKILTNLIK